ncbi:hypothetical protein AB0L06_31685 [Spirillospora sp. NPDC052269]
MQMQRRTLQTSRLRKPTQERHGRRARHTMEASRQRTHGRRIEKTLCPRGAMPLHQAYAREQSRIIPIGQQPDDRPKTELGGGKPQIHQRRPTTEVKPPPMGIVHRPEPGRVRANLDPVTRRPEPPRLHGMQRGGHGRGHDQVRGRRPSAGDREERVHAVLPPATRTR